MKKIFLLAFAFMALTVAAQTQQADTTARFTTTVHDFGDIAQGVPQTHTFIVKNTGTEPLIIQNVKASCGCTAPGWTKEPIAPGATGEVKATYNAASVGSFSKTLTVTTNGAPANVTLYIRGKVLTPATQKTE